MISWDLLTSKGYEPRPTEIMSTNGFVVGIMNNSSGGMFWYIANSKIQYWVDFKALYFAQEESKGLQPSQIEWLE